MQPTNSAIIGTLSPERRAGNSTGIARSETASGIASTPSSAVAVMAPETLALAPHSNTQRLADWLAQSCGVVSVMRMGIGGAIAQAKIEPGADLPKALAGVERSLMPAPLSVIEGHLTLLWSRTKRRSEDATALDVMLEAYLQFLARWPGDVVISALSETYEWFPDQAEIERRMARHAEPRRLFAARLRDAIAKRSQQQDHPHVEDGSDAKARVAALVANFTNKGRATGQASTPPAPVETDEEFEARVFSDTRGPRPETIKQRLSAR